MISKEDYIKAWMEWKKLHPHLELGYTEETLSQDWDNMSPKERDRDYRHIETNVIVTRLASRNVKYQ